MSNPVLNDKIFNQVRDITDTSNMTISGTMNKSGLLILLTILGAMFGWNQHSALLLFGSLIVNLGLVFAISFKPQRASFLSQPYAFLEGTLLGSISSTYALLYPGIVTNALLLTLCCLVLMLALYKFRIIRVTERLRSVLMVATMAIAATYFINIILSFFGTHIPMIHEGTTAGIVFSLAVVGVAAFNLLLDFDMIEQLSMRGAPRYMEWYGGFALLVTIVWLYLEILRLLSKLNRK